MSNNLRDAISCLRDLRKKTKDKEKIKQIDKRLKELRVYMK